MLLKWLVAIKWEEILWSFMYKHKLDNKNIKYDVLIAGQFGNSNNAKKLVSLQKKKPKIFSSA